MNHKRKPKVFIASSTEGLGIARAIHSVLDHDVIPSSWPHGTFSLSNQAVEDLTKKSSDVDFAVFVFHPDDLAEIRGDVKHIVRDNVIFELGLFIGAIGRHRCYVVRPRDVDLHLPSDLLGLTPADYDPSREDDLMSAVVQACTKIQLEIKKYGLLERSVATENGTVRIPRPNPPEFKLVEDDLRYLAIAAASHVSAPSGLSSWNFSNSLQGWTEQDINLSAIKLLRLGYIEKKISEDRDGESYYSIFITDEGIDALLNSNVESNKNPSPAPLLKPRSKSVPKFNGMDDDIPF